MCKNCHGTDGCSASTLDCLVASDEAVLFTRHTMLTQELALFKDSFQLICPDGTCTDVDNYAGCNVGAVPSRALVTSTASANSSGLLTAVT